MTAVQKMMFGKDVKNHRLEKGMTQADCAVVFGVSVVAFQRWEQGVGAPNNDNLEKVCEAFGMQKEKYFV